MSQVDRAAVLEALRTHRITPAEAKRLLTVGADQVAATRAEAEPPGTGPIAIVGMSGRYAAAGDLDAYWRMLADGADGVRPLPPRFGGADMRDIVSPRIGYLDGVEMFDPTYFQIPHAEARAMDPQHRMFLEECAAAFQSAGYARARLAGTRCGVYLGLANGDYLLLGDRAGSPRASVTSSSNAIAAGRVSYFYDLAGPALTIDTACSSSLVAVHLAVTALRSGEIDMAVAGGAATYLSPDGLAQMADAGMLSPTGACHALSDDADGFVPGEGAGAVVLKRLADALRDGDPVRALIIGSGINQDGRTNGITAPSLASQRALAEEVYERESIDPRTISYAELHGTGTILGDPVELTALAGAFRRWTSDTGFCSVGSVKSNLGHTSAAAGVAGLQKIVMCLEHRELVPTLHFSAPNRHFDLAGSPFTVGTEHRQWRSESARRAVLSSFGFSGTNAHLVVQEHVEQPRRPDAGDTPVVLVVSAHSPEQLRLCAQRLAAALEREPELAATDVALTLQRGRDALPERAAAVARDRSEALSLLHQLAASGQGWYRGRARPTRDAAVTAADGLDAVAQAWVGGNEVDWATLPQTSSGRSVVLPTYPFERVPLWFEGSGQARGARRGEERSRVSIDSRDWRVDQHRIEGVPVLPATASAEILLRQADERHGDSAPALVDLRWEHPLEAREEHLELDVQRGDDGQLSILSHSRVCVVAREATAGPSRSVDLASVSALPEVTARTAPAAITYGPRYQALRDPRAEGGQATGLLVPPEDSEDSAWAGVMDSAWQCVGPLLPAGGTYLPLAAERFEIWGEAQQARHVVATRRAGESLCFDVDITAADGTVLASTSGLVLAPVGGTGVVAVARRWTPGAETGPRPAARPRVCLAGDAGRLQPALEGVADLVSRAQDSDAVIIVLPTTSADAQGVQDLFECCQEVVRPLLTDGVRGTRVLLVDLAGGSSPAAAAMAGYAATLRLESSLVVSLLQIRATEDLARHVLEETAQADLLVRVANDQRRVAVMAEVELPEHVEPRAETALVVGGSSGVGALVARAVVAAGGRAAVLSRSGAPDPLPNWAEAAGDNLLYLVADAAVESDVARAVDRVHQVWGTVDALYHVAGVLDDALVRSTTADQVSRVLAPKAGGFDVVDQVLREEPLERVVLFSSLSAWLGNPGQAAYCVANAYLDEAAARRERQREAGERQGRTVSIGWPYWAEGGMTISDDAVEAARRDLGMVPLDTAVALSLIDRAVASSESAIACGQGSVPAMRRALLQPQEEAGSPERAGAGSRELALAAAGRVRQAVCEATGTPPERVRLDDTFEDLGMDSIVMMTATRALERDFGSLPKTLFLEHRSIDEVALTLAGTHADTCAALARAQEPAPTPEASVDHPARPGTEGGPGVASPSGRTSAQHHGASSGNRDLAVIGMSGRFPGARDLPELWTLLREGRDCITEVPLDRWDHAAYVSDDGTPGTTYARWGGFLEDVDAFDPLFFGISPAEASFLDPQARLFLQECWHAVEDAGYSRAQLAGRAIGVFVGIMYGHYGMLRGDIEGRSVPVPSSFAAVANRVSHFMDLRGPSIAFDTMCSSSLTALHAAAASIRSGEAEMALVGGVNLTIHPDKLVLLSQGKFAARDGRCRAFGQGGTGYVPGEAVAALLLKPVDRAVADGDHIWGVIRGTAVNSGGHAGGFTVPSSQAQAEVITAALHDAEVDPDSISYIEAHGTGTELGDPIEVRALATVLGGGHRDQPCLIGSVKSNIGHCESAAGVAGLAKILLQLQHGQVAPSLHADPPNPHIDFAGAGVAVAKSLVPWTADPPRRAGLSAFGAGGANAHVVVEEAPAVARCPESQGRHVLVFSARDEDRLRAVLQEFIAYVTRTPLLRLDDVALTLQTGREEMAQRAAVVVGSLDEAVEQIQHVLDGQGSSVLLGRAQHHGSVLEQDPDDEQRVMGLLRAARLDELARAWVAGRAVPWQAGWQGRAARRVSLPGYPFARERCWAEPPADAEERAGRYPHPLLHANRSTMDQVVFTTSFTGAESWIRDHHVDGGPVLPAAAMVEMLRAAAQMALRAPVVLSQVTFVRACREPASAPLEVHAEREGDGVHVRLVGTDEGAEVEYCDALAQMATTPASQERVALAELRAAARTRVEGAEVYSALAGSGLDYGPTHRVVRDVIVGTDAAVAMLRRSGAAVTGALLDPALLDGAFQSTWAFLNQGDDAAAGQMLPFSIGRVEVGSGGWQSWDEAAVVTTPADTDHGDERCVHVRICSPTGDVLARISDLRFRASSTGRMIQVPEWRPAPLARERQDLPTTWRVLTAFERLGTYMPALAETTLLPSDASFEQDYIRAAETTLSMLQRLPSDRCGRTVVQLVLPDGSLLAGLLAMLRSVRAEEEDIEVQALLCPDASDPASVARWAGEEAGAAVLHEAVRRSQHERETETLREEPWPVTAPRHADGVWLISGGAGGVGRLVAEDLADRARRNGDPLTLVLLGRTEPQEEIRALTARLGGDGVSCRYIQVDICDEPALRRAVAEVVAEAGPVTDVIHAAGVLRDGLVATKSAEAVREVLRPKVTGTMALHRATADQPLRSFVLCSSLAGTVGNAGQSDYAAANGFQDEFAAWRRDLVRRGKVSGATVSIAWPLWQDGGMTLSRHALERMDVSTGMVPLPTRDALEVLHAARHGDETRLVPLVGSLPAVRGYLSRCRRNDSRERGGPLTREAEAVPQRRSRRQPQAPGIGGGSDTEKVADRLREILASLTRIDRARLDLDEEMESYGVDSIIVMSFAERLRPTMGRVPKSLFFDNRTLRELAGSLLETRPQECAVLLGAGEGGESGRQDASAREAAAHERQAEDDPPAHEQIAVIGLAGRYPHAEGLAEFWQNLVAGRDCVDRLDRARWEALGAPVWDQDPATGWAGLLKDADCFDDRYFSIAPVEAEVMDPQERILLECAHHALEDSGYVPQDLGMPQEDRSMSVGVYVGAMYSEYQLYAAQSQMTGTGYTLNGAPASLANRISYTYGFGGPSLTIDSMCSSSLTALHLACESLGRGECEAALVGGVNLSPHPNKFRLLHSSGFAASHGRCKAFGADADGYVPSEGVGVAVLKPLSRALADGDHVYGVIAATAVGHGGRSNGFTVPRPAAQARVVSLALDRAGVKGSDVAYVEAHGTGTRLGDPLEIEALGMALGPGRQRACLVGSVKSNIGHCESAAGIVSLTKVLLQMQHGTLVPSIHADELNPEVDWDGAGLELVTSTRPWPDPAHCTAGISTFGAGGTNAHVIVTSAPEPERERPAPAMPVTVEIPLSACRQGDLGVLASQLLEWSRSRSLQPEDLVDIAFTLQAGRLAQDHRALVVAGSQEELERELDALVSGKTGRPALTDTGRAWLAGEKVAWPRPQGSRRISLPGYPFARRRHWRPTAVTVPPVPPTHGASLPGARETLHPLLHRNESTLFTQQFVSSLGPGVPQAADHRVAGQPVLAGAASLEMMRTAASASLEHPAHTLTDIVWPAMVPLDSPIDVRTVLTPTAESLRAEVVAQDRAVPAASATVSLEPTAPVVPGLDLDALRGICGEPSDAAPVRRLLASCGLDHLGCYRQLRACSSRGDQVLARLGALESESPSLLAPMLNAAFECAVLLGSEQGLYLPYAAESARFSDGPLPMRAWAHLIRRRGPADRFVLDLSVADEAGRVIVEIDGLVLRELKEPYHA
ncbi:SDR family NAD(P)-dependent oxidoreductase [Actinomyces timonensis]|uniref:SDR family NAD(P)-dependent oxidoreductase n=1 Tax=Actinomyces timonensis TaxID=1288391 RepID=UPI0002F617AA|nr:SDR family NAD(P)-dependent oxidoreductase [Actinomyces timonensis]